MSDDKTLFTPEDVAEQIDPDKDYHSELVGEDKRYKTDQDFARSKVEGDFHIKRLERENAGLRDELNGRTAMENMLTELKGLRSNEPTDTNDTDSNSGQQSGGETNDHSPQSITSEEIEQIVSKRLQSERETANRSDNFNHVKKALETKWGSSAQQNLQKACDDLGLSTDDANTLAQTQPKAFLRMIGVDKPAEQQPDTNNLFVTGNVDPQSVSPSTTGATVRNNAFYEKMRTSDDPSVREQYWSKETQLQMHEDALEQGQAFFTN